MTKCNTPTLNDAAMAAMRLNKAGYPLKHAVSLASGSFGYSTGEIYKELARVEAKRAEDRQSYETISSWRKEFVC